MKLFGKIVLLLVVMAVVLIVLYPSKITPKLDGNWAVEKMILNGKQYDLHRIVTIDGSRFNADLGLRKLLDNDSIEYTFKFINSDSIVIASNYPAIFSGRYKINQQTKVIGGGNNAYRDIRLHLKSKEKLITLSRSENVVWQKGIPRGTP